MSRLNLKSGRPVLTSSKNQLNFSLKESGIACVDDNIVATPITMEEPFNAATNGTKFINIICQWVHRALENLIESLQHPRLLEELGLPTNQLKTALSIAFAKT